MSPARLTSSLKNEAIDTSETFQPSSKPHSVTFPKIEMLVFNTTRTSKFTRIILTTRSKLKRNSTTLFRGIYYSYVQHVFCLKANFLCRIILANTFTVCFLTHHQGKFAPEQLAHLLRTWQFAVISSTIRPISVVLRQFVLLDQYLEVRSARRIWLALTYSHRQYRVSQLENQQLFFWISQRNLNMFLTFEYRICSRNLRTFFFYFGH